MLLFLLNIGCAPKGWIEGDLPSWTEDSASQSSYGDSVDDEENDEEEGEEDEN